jgi:DHA3 family tetracycline resistance protein-like MFS transporter
VSKPTSARFVFLVISAGGAFLATVVFTITPLYRIESAGLNPLELVLVGTFMEAAVFVFEIPTGIVADVYSRRLSIIIGNIGMGIGFVIEGAYPHVGTIMAAQIFWGITYTFTSGATEAWLAGEVGESALTGIFLRAQQLGQIGALVAIVVAISLGQIDLWVPIVVGGVLQIALGVWLILVMPETGFTRVPPAERETWTALRTTARNGFGAIRRSRALMLLAVAAALAGAASEPFDRLWQAKYLKEVHFPTFGGWSDLTWFGILNVASLLLGIALSTVARRRVKEVTSERTLTRIVASLMALQVVGLVIFGLAGGFLFATIGFFLYSRSRSLQRPFYSSWVIPMIDPDVRATALSAMGQADAIGQVVGGPAIGAIGTAVSLQAALLAGAALQAPAVALTLAAGAGVDSDAVPELLEDGGAPDGVLEHPPVTET